MKTGLHDIRACHMTSFTKCTEEPVSGADLIAVCGVHPGGRLPYPNDRTSAPATHRPRPAGRNRMAHPGPGHPARRGEVAQHPEQLGPVPRWAGSPRRP